MRKVFATFGVALLLSSLASGEDDDYVPQAYAIVRDRAVAMEKMPRKNGNLYPWLDGSRVIINSCGFARLTYNEIDIDAFLSDAHNEYKIRARKSPFYFLTNEWCDAAELLFEHSSGMHIIGYRKWRGKKYAVSDADVYIDNDGVPYVVDKFFIESLGLMSLVRAIANGESHTGCFGEGYRVGNVVEASSNMVATKGGWCLTKGVWLKDILLTANNSLQRR